jgi:hypothetical protein
MGAWEKGFDEGKTFGFGQGFTAGFWAAVLLIGGVVMLGLLIMEMV